MQLDLSSTGTGTMVAPNTPTDGKSMSLRALACVVSCAFVLSALSLHAWLSADTIAAQSHHAAVAGGTDRAAVRRLGGDGAFVRRTLDGPGIPALAASGLAILPGYPRAEMAILAVANFWGESSLYELDGASLGLAPRLVQQLATKSAHDWEVVHGGAAMEGGGSQDPTLVCSEYAVSYTHLTLPTTPYG